MSGFGIGINVKSIDNGEIRGRSYPIACKAWFTSNCSMRPLSFKFEGEDNIIQTISDISIISAEDKNYSGVPSIEFKCNAIIGGITNEFKLVFYKEACKWIMVLP